MSVSRKRKAREEKVREYSSETVQIQQPWFCSPAAIRMGFVNGILAVWGAFTSLSPRQSTNTATRITNGGIPLDRGYEVPAQNKTHSNTTQPALTTAKRRKPSPDTLGQASQSRSQPRPIAGRTKYGTQASHSQSQSQPRTIVDGRKHGGLRETNVERCTTSEEARERLEQYWEPPDLTLGRRKSIVKRPNTSAADESNDTSLLRRHSDPAETLRDLHISPPHEDDQRARKESEFRGFAPPNKASSARDQYLRAQFQLKSSESPDLGNQLDLWEEDKNGNLSRLSRSAYRQRLSDEKKAKAEKERKEREAGEEKARKENALREAREARLRRRQPASDLIQPLFSEWDDLVTENMGKDKAATITKSEGGTELRVKDFITLLADRDWLNDEIINAYIEWVVAAANEAAAQEAKALGVTTPSTVPKFIAHNSFFYNNIKDKGPTTVDRLMKRKKAPGVSLLEVDTVLVPICSHNHWTIGVVRPVARTIEYFDSMGHPGMAAGATFIAYMRGWLQHQLGKAYVASEWSEPHTRCAHQSNGYDCGVFVCTNAFCVATGLDPFCYHERDMAVQRRRIAAVLINRGFKGDFAWMKGLELP